MAEGHTDFCHSVRSHLSSFSAHFFVLLTYSIHSRLNTGSESAFCIDDDKLFNSQFMLILTLTTLQASMQDRQAAQGGSSETHV